MKQRSIIVFALMTLSLGWSVQAIAQENTSHVNTSTGTFNLLASLNGYGPFALQSPSGNGSGDPKIIFGIGGRYYVGEKWAVRAILNVGSQSDGKDSDSRKSSAFALGAAIEWHCHQLYSTDIYTGAGLGYNTTSLTTPVIVDGQPSGGITSQAATTQETKYVFNSFGFTLLAGFDWYLWNGIAIGAEYSLGFASIASTTTSNGTTTTNPTTAQFGNSGGTNIHLVVSF